MGSLIIARSHILGCKGVQLLAEDERGEAYHSARLDNTTQVEEPQLCFRRSGIPELRTVATRELKEGAMLGEVGVLMRMLGSKASQLNTSTRGNHKNWDPGSKRKLLFIIEASTKVVTLLHSRWKRLPTIVLKIAIHKGSALSEDSDAIRSQLARRQ